MLSKSDFSKYLDCSCLLWLVKSRRDLLPPDGDERERRFEQGEIVDGLARQLYKNGVEVSGFHKTGFENTKKAIADGAKVLFQPTAVFGELNARADILVLGKSGAWDIHEVKSSVSVKDEHLYDLGFQRFVFEKAGFKIGKTVLVHLNRDYVRRGEIDPEALFVKEDVSAGVDAIMAEVEKTIPDALAVMKWKKEPDKTHLMACNDPTRCEHIGHWLGSLKPKPLSELLKLLPPKTVARMLEREIVASPQLTEQYLETIDWKPPHVRWPKQVDPEAIAADFAKLKYPLHFLDYETHWPAIPSFDGGHPYQQVPFQFSVVVIPKLGAKEVRYDFLKDTFEDPVPELVEHLRKAIGDKGTVIAWNAVFEKGCNEFMAKRVPSRAAFLRGVNGRMYDLMLIFRRQFYRLPEFRGSASLKAVLPNLIPKLSYENLEIQEGGTASASWPILTGEHMLPAKRKKLREDMIDYCHRDVIGMVKILEHLREVSE